LADFLAAGLAGTGAFEAAVLADFFAAVAMVCGGGSVKNQAAPWGRSSMRSGQQLGAALKA
jgi:hypothetical protein